MQQLIVENLTKAFTDGKASHFVLQDLCFAVNEGEFWSIVGPSGCGKTNHSVEHYEPGNLISP